MKYGMFVDQFKIAKDKDEFIKKHVIYNYVPYLEKVNICNMIINTCLYKTIDNIEKKKVFSKNTPLKYVMFITTIINKYTDIEFDTDMNVAQIYDVLNQNKLLDHIMEFIPKEEYVEFNTILAMVEDDELTNNQSIVNWLNEQINITEIMKSTFNDAVDEINNQVVK